MIQSSSKMVWICKNTAGPLTVQHNMCVFDFHPFQSVTKLVAQYNSTEFFGTLRIGGESFGIPH